MKLPEFFLIVSHVASCRVDMLHHVNEIEDRRERGKVSLLDGPVVGQAIADKRPFLGTVEPARIRLGRPSSRCDNIRRSGSNPSSSATLSTDTARGSAIA